MDCGGRLVKAISAIDPQLTPGSTAVAFKQSEVTNTRNTGKTTKSAPNVTEAPKQAPLPKTMKTATHVKSSQPKPNDLVTTPHPNQSPIEEISDPLDNLPLNACVDLTRRILTSVPTITSGPARLLVVLKTVVLFVSAYSITAYTDKNLLKPCGWPAGTPTVSAEGNWKFIISSVNTWSMCAS